MAKLYLQYSGYPAHLCQVITLVQNHVKTDYQSPPCYRLAQITRPTMALPVLATLMPQAGTSSGTEHPGPNFIPTSKCVKDDRALADPYPIS